MKRIIYILNMAGNIDLAALVLRLWLSVALFSGHGWEKIAKFSQMKEHFPDPVHLGSTLSFLIAFFSDSICSLLIGIGLFTRIAAAYIAITVAVAFLLVWHGNIFKIDGELPFIYLGAYLTILIIGPGKYSVDDKLKRVG